MSQTLPSYFQLRQLIVLFIAATIESRIKDDSVEVVCNSLIDEACAHVMQIDQHDTTDIMNNEYASFLGELEIQIFNRIQDFDTNRFLVEALAKKRFRSDQSGIDFLISNNFYAVTNFRNELYPYLKSSNLKQLANVVHEFAHDDDDMKSKWDELFKKHPELLYSKSTDKHQTV